mmetsp:Transcript_43074/g.108265  ORF Transcript_43074/g.108265 Transcript_43074/m.108265 type:complete len:95 (-) Transcript_43074:1390-1674(-)
MPAQARSSERDLPAPKLKPHLPDHEKNEVRNHKSQSELVTHSAMVMFVRSQQFLGLPLRNTTIPVHSGSDSHSTMQSLKLMIPIMSRLCMMSAP